MPDRRDPDVTQDCCCDPEWPEAHDGACPEHGLAALIADVQAGRDPR